MGCWMKDRGTSWAKRGAAPAVLVAGALCLPLPAAAQSTATIATTRVRDSVRVMTLADLDFGRIMPGTSGSGSIVVSPSGTVTTSAGVVSFGGTQPARFNLKRRILRDYVTYLGPGSTDSIILTSRTNPAHKMVVNEFSTDFYRTAGFFPAYWFTTSYDFQVGARLVVPANQPPGEYIGTFRVQVNYP